MKYSFVSLLLLGLFALNSCSISKGFDALNEFNYFEAKKQFHKSLKNDRSPAAYGLSMLFYKTNNPFHDLDSAYHYSLLSVECYNHDKQKKKDKWLKDLDYSLDKALIHRLEIDSIGFQEAVTENTPEGFSFFITKYPWSLQVFDAAERRDSLAFLIAEEEGTSKAFTEFLEKYTKSKWEGEALELLYQAEYEETVESSNTKSYMDFIQRYPDNPHVHDAEYQIYKIETKDNTVNSYTKFIKGFPNSPFIDEVWTKLYRLSIANYTKENIEQFRLKYPDFPFPALIKQDLQMVGQELYQFVSNDKFGFMDSHGNVQIPAKLEYVEQFKNGLAVATQNKKYGYIDKEGRTVIDFQYDEAYDFNHGRAVVVKNDHYGLIDVMGNYILDPIYEDIGSYSEDLIYVQSEEGYRYHTLDGTVAFSTVYDEAFSFKNGIAKVRKGDKIGYISTDGTFVVSVVNGDLREFSDSLYVHEERTGMNLLAMDGHYVFEEKMDRIGVLSEQRAIIEKGGKYGYINAKGEIKIPINYTTFSNFMQFAKFENGHAIYKQGDKYAMIDAKGDKVLPAIFIGIGRYGDLIPITKGAGWGYTDQSVNLKIPYTYEYAHEFIKGTAIVENDGLSGLINLKNEPVMEIEFETITRLKDDLLLVKKAGLWGVYSTAGQELIKPKYQRISEFSEHILQLVAGNQIYYYDVTNRQTITLKK